MCAGLLTLTLKQTVLLSGKMANRAEPEQVWLTLNHQGEDYNVVVDLATAEMLLNDPEKAEAYIASCLEKNNEEDATETEDTSTCVVENGTTSIIWRSKGL